MLIFHSSLHSQARILYHNERSVRGSRKDGGPRRIIRNGVTIDIRGQHEEVRTLVKRLGAKERCFIGSAVHKLATRVQKRGGLSFAEGVCNCNDPGTGNTL